MSSHECRVYPYHCAFLKDFPELSGWLDCNGFTVVHSFQDFGMQVLYTFWSDYTNDVDGGSVNEAREYLVIAYCQKCKTVEVYRRKIITAKENEKRVVRELQRMFGTPGSDEACSEESDRFSTEELTREIEDLLDDTKRM